MNTVSRSYICGKKDDARQTELENYRSFLVGWVMGGLESDGVDGWFVRWMIGFGLDLVLWVDEKKNLLNRKL